MSLVMICQNVKCATTMTPRQDRLGHRCPACGHYQNMEGVVLKYDAPPHIKNRWRWLKYRIEQGDLSEVY